MGISAPQRLREAADEQIDQRPHAERRRDGADAERRTEDEADENTDGIGADAAEAEWDAGPIGQNERNRVVRRDALIGGVVQRRRQTQQDEARGQLDDAQRKARMRHQQGRKVV